jgi:hypothetical protein
MGQERTLSNCLACGKESLWDDPAVRVPLMARIWRGLPIERPRVGGGSLWISSGRVLRGHHRMSIPHGSSLIRWFLPRPIARSRWTVQKLSPWPQWTPSKQRNSIDSEVVGGEGHGMRGVRSPTHPSTIEETDALDKQQSAGRTSILSFAGAAMVSSDCMSSTHFQKIDKLHVVDGMTLIALLKRK